MVNVVEDQAGNISNAGRVIVRFTDDISKSLARGMT